MVHELLLSLLIFNDARIGWISQFLRAIYKSGEITQKNDIQIYFWKSSSISSKNMRQLFKEIYQELRFDNHVDNVVQRVKVI